MFYPTLDSTGLSTPIPAPTSTCRTFDFFLPVAVQDLLSQAHAAGVRDKVMTETKVKEAKAKEEAERMKEDGAPVTPKNNKEPKSPPRSQNRPHTGPPVMTNIRRSDMTRVKDKTKATVLAVAEETICNAYHQDGGRPTVIDGLGWAFTILFHSFEKTQGDFRNEDFRNCEADKLGALTLPLLYTKLLDVASNVSSRMTEKVPQDSNVPSFIFGCDSIATADLPESAEKLPPIVAQLTNPEVAGQDRSGAKKKKMARSLKCLNPTVQYLVRKEQKEASSKHDRATTRQREGHKAGFETKTKTFQLNLNHIKGSPVKPAVLSSGESQTALPIERTVTDEFAIKEDIARNRVPHITSPMESSSESSTSSSTVDDETTTQKNESPNRPSPANSSILDLHTMAGTMKDEQLYTEYEDCAANLSDGPPGELQRVLHSEKVDNDGATYLDQKVELAELEISGSLELQPQTSGVADEEHLFKLEKDAEPREPTSSTIVGPYVVEYQFDEGETAATYDNHDSSSAGCHTSDSHNLECISVADQDNAWTLDDTDSHSLDVTSITELHEGIVRLNNSSESTLSAAPELLARNDSEGRSSIATETAPPSKPSEASILLPQESTPELATISDPKLVGHIIQAEATITNLPSHLTPTRPSHTSIATQCNLSTPAPQTSPTPPPRTYSSVDAGTQTDIDARICHTSLTEEVEKKDSDEDWIVSKVRTTYPHPKRICEEEGFANVKTQVRSLLRYLSRPKTFGDV